MNRRTRNILVWIYALLGTLLLVLLLRMFACTTCIMPSGELLFLNKWSYGLRTPFPSLFGYHRILSAPVEKGEEVAFNNPIETGPMEFRQLYVCRCAGPTGSIIQFMGKPFRVPRKGDTVRVTPENKALLHEVIGQHEGKQAILSIEGVLYVDGNPITHYTFSRSYYWMETEKGSRLFDSHNFGLVPEELIIGRVFYAVGPMKIRELFD